MAPYRLPSAADCALGIDFGTGGARALVIDQAGQPLADARLALPQAPDDPRLPGLWREALLDIVARLPLALRRRLRTLAIDGTSSTCLICDRDNRPLLPPLLYHDSRAREEAESLRQTAPPDNVVLSPSSSLAKLLWFSRQPEVAAARYLAHQADWLAAQLHGRPGISDYHNALKLGYDVAEMRYPAWLTALPIAPLLPEVVAPGSDLGPILPQLARDLALPRDCRVRAGTTDSIAAFLASGATRPGDAVTSLGSTLVLKLLSRTRVEAARYGVYSHRLGNLWLPGGASNSGGAVLKAFFSDARLQALSARIDPSKPSMLDYYPLPGPGERFPLNDPALEPRLSPRPADDADFLHGLLEGMARIEARGYRLLEQLGATKVTRVLSAGGGARNTAWAAIRQRHLDVPVTPAPQTEAAYGAAVLAARGEKLLCFRQVSPG